MKCLQHEVLSIITLIVAVAMVPGAVVVYGRYALPHILFATVLAALTSAIAIYFAEGRAMRIASAIVALLMVGFFLILTVGVPPISTW